MKKRTLITSAIALLMTLAIFGFTHSKKANPSKKEKKHKEKRTEKTATETVEVEDESDKIHEDNKFVEAPSKGNEEILEEEVVELKLEAKEKLVKTKRVIIHDSFEEMEASIREDYPISSWSLEEKEELSVRKNVLDVFEKADTNDVSTMYFSRCGHGYRARIAESKEDMKEEDIEYGVVQWSEGCMETTIARFRINYITSEVEVATLETEDFMPIKQWIKKNYTKA